MGAYKYLNNSVVNLA